MGKMQSTCVLSALFLAVYAVCPATAQHTIYDDENDFRCEETCARHIDNLQTQLSRLQNELQQQRQELEELKKAVRPSFQHPDTAVADVRLVNGTTEREGRLEVKHNGVWGTVCDDEFNDVNVRVVCRQLGFGNVGVQLIYNPFGEGTSEILLDDVNCRGTEASLTDCQHRGWGVDNCGHHEDVAIKCVDNLAITDIRLVGSELANEGRLEVKVAGIWGTICGRGFDDVDAGVACYMLGFGRSGRSLGQQYGPGEGVIWMDRLQCKGTETNLADCGHLGWSQHSCRHDADVLISCTTD